VSDTYS